MMILIVSSILYSPFVILLILSICYFVIPPLLGDRFLPVQGKPLCLAGKYGSG